MILVAAATATVATLAAGCHHGSQKPPPPGAGDMALPPLPPGAQQNAIGVCHAWPRPSESTSIMLKPMFAGYTAPVGINQAPGDPNHFYVWEQVGLIFRVDATLPQKQTTALDLSAIPNKLVSGGEHGLLGFAFSPNWQTNHTAYIFYSTPSAAAAGFSNILARVTSSDGGATFTIATDNLLKIDKPFENHNGGNLLFGPDGYLYLGIGDGGSGYDPQGNGQNTTVLLAKMLRIDVENQATYAIPPSNPFANDTGMNRKEIFAWGMRNPWRWSFDRGTGDLWVGDVGQDRWEEIDKIKLGGNYGWSRYEGTHCTDGTTTCAPLPGALPPIIDYGHASTGDPDPGNCVIGGYFYRGSAIPSLVGNYVFADYGVGEVWRLVYDMTGKPLREILAATGKAISSFGEGLDGELYVVGVSDGTISKIVPAAAQPPSVFPDRLSATGCVDVINPTQVTSTAMYYDVNVPLWSDGADKRRWLSLPLGGQIHIESDGHWTLPIGTVLVKEFSVGGKRIETRLLMRHDDGDWAGYSYQWLDDQSDAVLLPSSATKDLGNGMTWYFPSRTDCLQCHTVAAGRTLGMWTAQMNRDAPDGSGNQMAMLDAAGLFDVPLPPPPATLAQFPQPGDSTAPVGDRARAYLHANCSFCHRMGGPGRVPPDWRDSLTLAQTGACNAAPQDGDLGVTGALVVAPGMPGKSVTSLRMRALDATRMPPLASHVVDPTGTSLIDAWITSLTSCN